MQVQIPYNFTPRPYQLEALQHFDTGGTDNKRLLIRWPRRAGKDKFSFCLLIKEAISVPGNYLYIFPEATQARRSLWKAIDSNGQRVIDHLPPIIDPKTGENLVRINNQEMFIEVPTVCGRKSTIQVIGLDKDPSKVRGMSCRGAIFSEFAYQNPDAYKTLLPAIRETKGWIIFNSTPAGKNHMWDLEQAVKDDKGWYVSHKQSVWPDDPNYIGVYIGKDHFVREDAQKILEQWMIEEQSEWEDIEREYGASYSAGISGSIFIREIKEVRSSGRVGIYPHDSNFPVFAYCDIGYEDATSIWFVQYIQSQIRFIDYFEKTQMNMPDIARCLMQKPYDIYTVWLPWDANMNFQLENTKAELLAKTLKAYKNEAIVRVYDKRLKVQERINCTKERFSRYVFNAATCGEALDVLALYHKKYDVKLKQHTKEPVHDWTSHCADAITLEAIVAEEDYRISNIEHQNTVKVIRCDDFLQ